MARFIAVASLLLLSACAAQPASVTAGPDHPANPDAPSAAVAPSTDVHAGHHHGDAAPAAAQLYQCPMHPEVTSTNPEDKCPKCGMKINQPVKPADRGGRQ
jgi:hypothetical protein